MLRRREANQDDREHQLHLRGDDNVANNKQQQHLPDPFTLDLNIEPRDWPGIALGTVLLAPWRAVLVLLLMVLAWAACKVGLMGVPSGKEGDAAPRKGWRRWIMDHVYASFGKNCC